MGLFVLYPFDNGRRCILIGQSPPSPGNGICQIGTRLDGHDRARHVEAHRPTCLGLWAVHVILASPIVYSLLPEPHIVLEKPQKKSKRGDDCCFSCLVTFLFLRETYSAQPTAPGRPLTWFRVCALIGDSGALVTLYSGGRLETTCKEEILLALFRLQ